MRHFCSFSGCYYSIYNNKYRLRKHELLHGGPGVVKCSYKDCNFACANGRAYTSHIRYCHFEASTEFLNLRKKYLKENLDIVRPDNSHYATSLPTLPDNPTPSQNVPKFHLTKTKKAHLWDESSATKKYFHSGANKWSIYEVSSLNVYVKDTEIDPDWLNDPEDDSPLVLPSIDHDGFAPSCTSTMKENNAKLFVAALRALLEQQKSKRDPYTAGYKKLENKYMRPVYNLLFADLAKSSDCKVDSGQHRSPNIGAYSTASTIDYEFYIDVPKRNKILLACEVNPTVFPSKSTM